MTVQCAWCLAVRVAPGQWQKHDKRETGTHGICPECSEKVLAPPPRMKYNEDTSEERGRNEN